MQVQAFQFANYHVTNAEIFYSKEDFWAVPKDPAFCGNEAENPACKEVGTPNVDLLRPSYQLLKLPGEAQEEFVLLLPFVPEERTNMVAWFAARSDPAHYGELVAYVFPSGRNVLGPSQVFAQINADAGFSEQRTLLGQAGSEVRFGDFLVIPIEDSFLYVQPAYVRSEGASTIPELTFVVAVDGNGTVAVQDNLADAVAELIGAAPPDGGEQPPPTGDVATLLAQALEHFQKADVALKAGDLATYQSELALARALVQQAEALTGGGVSPSPSPSPSA